ncbi:MULTISPECIES: hypothetical protein [Actinoalloteichus]|uniref:hypothetical protein n=1 Tax=Actinoalloteichus TaxID=65496 RepID=UPI0012DFD7FD|nr:hypothetical protein [Actinoalloteichus caeruleus]
MAPRQSAGPRTSGFPLLIVSLAVIAVVLGALVGALGRSWYAGDDEGEAPAGEATSPVEPPAPDGPVRVELTPDARAHPDHEAILALVSAHFESINARDYGSWATTVVERRVRDTSEEDWLSRYRSTRDDHVVVHRVEQGPEDSLRVLMTFVSGQDLADAPPEMPAECVHWRVVYPLVVEGGELRLDSGRPGSSSPGACG